ncbi:MAG: uncharacterized protein KVP18_000546 [Porospora cf. gigantea A]|uniref:uncharacterized protein n=2 Tax=Porospora cf. gigantea A TaxID=2853593 RepID=UPI003559B144|nr:MAG: hypothetical protein KVP18_000546 [Porospora cf. gigantea A]
METIKEPFRNHSYESKSPISPLLGHEGILHNGILKQAPASEGLEKDQNWYPHDELPSPSRKASRQVSWDDDIEEGSPADVARKEFDILTAGIKITNSMPADQKRKIQRARNRLSAQKHREKQRDILSTLKAQCEEERQRAMTAEVQINFLSKRNEELRKQLEMAKDRSTQLETRIQFWAVFSKKCKSGNGSACDGDAMSTAEQDFQAA